MEVKFGFIPNSTDTTAWRVRRRYRMHKGGHPQLVLIHYSRGQAVRTSAFAHLAIETRFDTEMPLRKLSCLP